MPTAIIPLWSAACSNSFSGANYTLCIGHQNWGCRDGNFKAGGSQLKQFCVTIARIRQQLASALRRKEDRGGPTCRRVGVGVSLRRFHEQEAAQTLFGYLLVEEYGR